MGKQADTARAEIQKLLAKKNVQRRVLLDQIKVLDKEIAALEKTHRIGDAVVALRAAADGALS